jgi:hypothetical protein
MAAFYVGQRVRMVRPRHSQFIGDTGVIVALYEQTPGLRYAHNCDVRWDKPAPAHFATYTHTDRLEPILPEGWQPVEWSECLWQPEGIAA